MKLKKNKKASITSIKLPSTLIENKELSELIGTNKLNGLSPQVRETLNKTNIILKSHKIDLEAVYSNCSKGNAPMARSIISNILSIKKQTSAQTISRIFNLAESKVIYSLKNKFSSMPQDYGQNLEQTADHLISSYQGRKVTKKSKPKLTEIKRPNQEKENHTETISEIYEILEKDYGIAHQDQSPRYYGRNKLFVNSLLCNILLNKEKLSDFEISRILRITSKSVSQKKSEFIPISDYEINLRDAICQLVPRYRRKNQPLKKSKEPYQKLINKPSKNKTIRLEVEKRRINLKTKNYKTI